VAGLSVLGIRRRTFSTVFVKSAEGGGSRFVVELPSVPLGSDAARLDHAGSAVGPKG
jgi:hypothetical protein